jgi:penicillin amidase
LGVTAPGVPFVAMGHNGEIAWSFTVGAVDIIDYFQFSLEGDQLSAGSLTLPLSRREEKILVKGQEAQTLEVLWSAWGPVMDASEPGEATVCRWPGFEQPPDQVLSSGFELHECREFQDFRKVVTSFGSLEVNWVYSDRQGNIGYQLGSPLPLRSVEDTTTLLDAGDPQTHWQGYWPLEETPHAFNPIQGYLASCNNEMSWDPKLPGFYDPYRIARISTLLEAKDQHSLEDLGDYQLDTVSQRFLRWRTLLENAAFDLGWVSLAKSLKSWDGNMLPDDTRPTLMLYWWRQLQEEVFLDELGADYRLAGTIFERTLSDPTNQWIDDQTTPQKETLEDLAKRALSRLSETQRDTPYHRVFTYAPAHPFARIPLLDWLLPLRRGPLPWPGSGTSLRAAFWEKTDHGFQVVNGPSMRFLLDWQQVDGFLLNLPLGQSGNPFDPHFADFFDAPKRWCVPFSKSAVLAKASSTLKLMPKEKP